MSGIFDSSSVLSSGANSSDELRTPLLQPVQDQNALDQAGANISRLNNNVAQLQRYSELLGTTSDNSQLRSNIKNLRNDTMELSRITRTLLQVPIPLNDKKAKTKCDRLASQFDQALHQYEKVTQISLRKEREMVIELSRSVERRQTMALSAQQGSQLQKQALEELKELDEVDNRLIEEQNQDIKNIESDLQALNELFVDVNNLVGEQGEQLNVVEDHVISSDIQVQKGTEELTVAAKYQKSARKKIILIIVGVVVIIAIIVAVIVIAVKV